MALAGTETVHYDTASGSAIAAGLTTSLAIALLAGANPARSVNAVAAGAGTTLTGAAIVSGVITRSGPAAAFTDTIDTATNIIAALPTNTPFSTTWLLFIRNTTPFAETLATGVGVTLAGNTIVPANSVYIGMVAYTGSATVTITGLATAPLDTGAIETNTAITTVGAGTLTAASIVGGVITRSGPTGAFSDTTDTAVAIIAAIPNAYVGQSWELSIVNTTAFAETLVAASGVTLTGLSGPIPANATGRILATYTGAAAVSLQLIGIAYNAASGYDPSSVQTQFGTGVGTFLEEGLINRQVSAVGISPGATAADNVVAVYSLPANSLDGISNRGLTITAQGSFAVNGDTKRLKIIWNPATAVVGSTVGGSGTVVADTGAITTSGGSWQLNGAVYKYGAANSNTQLCFNQGTAAGAVHQGVGTTAPATAAAVENGAILIAITANCTTATTDVVFNLLTILAQN